MKKTSLLLSLVLTIGFAANVAVAVQKKSAPTSVPPEAVTREFYYWYLSAIYKDEEPFKDTETISKYITPRLINQLARLMSSPDGLDYDYFLNAQDYGDDWAEKISTSKIRIEGLTAKMEVSFGDPTDPDHRVKVTLKQIKGAWMIDKVEEREAEPSA
jgi:hypothetical protein